MTNERAACGSSRERMTTGRVLPAKPRSASQTSPAFWFIEDVQNFLFRLPGPRQIERVVIGQLDDLLDAPLDLAGGSWLPLLEFLVQLLCNRRHDAPRIRLAHPNVNDQRSCPDSPVTVNTS